MDTNFHKGDIVVFISILEKSVSFSDDMNNYFFLDGILNNSKIKNQKIFSENTYAYLNDEDNKVVAEFLFEKLHDQLIDKVEQPRQLVKSIFSQLPPHLNVA